MNTPVLVFVHGWGFDVRLWDGVRAALPEADTAVVDLGYFGRPASPGLPSDRPVVAVGHSFGCLWLLHEKPFAWAGLVAVNGFPRFVEGPDYAPATPRRVLDRMIARFETAPGAVLEEFRRRCGAAEPPPPADAGVLGAHLRALRDWDARAALTGPVLVLAGAEDPIVPPAMTERGFAGFAPDIYPGGGHLLPLTAPEWCARRIAAFATGLSS
jgi:pimeloyl-[acyl-carrier protein] methyl ester esterase